MEPKSVVRALWPGFRGLPGWVQLVIAVVVALVVVPPFTSEGDRQTVAATAPTTAAPAKTTTPAPTTTTTSTLAPGVPAQGEDTSVVRVIDGDTIEVT
ncbi:MAG TPA: hypothetical protein VNT52_04015, partial [Acidimicrobiales bacterium]|nr:hypothetical protein [Acidimicrobiales bacterium]